MDQLNYTGINLSDTQKYQLVGISTTGVACLVQSWKNQMSNPIDGKFCQVLWDGIYCWPATLANQTVDVPCSTFFGEKVFRKESTVRAFKICSEEGVWVGGTYTNYSSCIKNMKELALVLLKARVVTDGV
ncbi:unnamed protein product [Allacma fusca]|uniref:G-protein coupled receptors family 2 profile 1 domain-containing protein n=1 Tax=Allacma fusca TaxID=39272 RepID=A0A8J2KJM2_9HEXA|nr:unnamed protein product [Allacma fusca]